MRRTTGVHIALQLRPNGLLPNVRRAVFHTLPRLLDHIFDDILCGLDVLAGQLYSIVRLGTTRLDQSTDITHEPHSALERLLGMFL